LEPRSVIENLVFYSRLPGVNIFELPLLMTSSMHLICHSPYHTLLWRSKTHLWCHSLYFGLKLNNVTHAVTQIVINHTQYYWADATFPRRVHTGFCFNPTRPRQSNSSSCISGFVYKRPLAT